MTFSGLTSLTVSTQKFSSREGYRPRRFVLHHTAGGGNEGNLQLLSANNGYDVSANYLSFTDGRLAGIVPEEYRAWTTGWTVDRDSITQETVNIGGAPDWPVSEKQLETTARLLADLSTRYGWGRIRYGENFFVHQNFYSTQCPGPFLMRHILSIQDRANAILSGQPDPKERTVIHYFRDDPNASGAGRTLAPGGQVFLNVERGAGMNAASNLVGGVGYYSITPHVYAEGAEGDAIELALVWQDEKTKPRPSGSPHFVERVEIGRGGLIRASREFKRAVSNGFAVYLRITTPRENRSSVRVTRAASDAYLFTNG